MKDKKVLKKITDYRTELESIENQLRAGRYNAATEVIIPAPNSPTGENRMKISAGRSDELTIFEFGKFTLVVCINRRLNYVGLDIFEGEEVIGDVFYDDQMVRETFRRKEIFAENVARKLFLDVADISPSLYKKSA